MWICSSLFFSSLLSLFSTCLSSICFPVPASRSVIPSGGIAQRSGARGMPGGASVSRASRHTKEEYSLWRTESILRNLFVVLIHSLSYSFAPEEQTRREERKSDTLVRRSLLLKIPETYFSEKHLSLFFFFLWALSKTLLKDIFIKISYLELFFETYLGELSFRKAKTRNKEKGSYQERFPK